MQESNLRNQLQSSIHTVRQAMWRDTILATVLRLGATDLSFAQFGALLFLETTGSARVSAVAAAVSRSVAATSRVLDSLVQRGLIERVEDAADRRAKQVCLSQQGLDWIATLEQSRVEAQLSAMAWLDPAEQALVAQAMTLLAEAIHRRNQHVEHSRSATTSTDAS